MAQWWEHLSTTNYVAQVRILNFKHHKLFWVCYWFSSCSKDFSLGFSSSTKTTTSKILIRFGNSGQRASLWNVPKKIPCMYWFWIYYLYLNDTWWTFTFSYEEGTLTPHLQKGFFCLISCYLSMEPSVILGNNQFAIF